MEQNKYINKSLEKSFRILEILSQSVFPLKASSISRKATISRTTTFRLLSVLNQLGYIHKNTSTNTYTMGHKAFQFGEISDYLQSISEESRDILNDVSKTTGLITYLAMLEGPQIVHSDKISSNNDSGNFRTFRMRLDANCCAIGKVILAYRPDHEKRSFAGISFSGSKSLMSPKLLEDYIKILQSASIKISNLIVDK